MKRKLCRCYRRGNGRPLEQAVRRIIRTRHYRGDSAAATPVEPTERLLAGIEAGSLDAQQLMVEYCGLLYRRFGTYDEVALATSLGTAARSRNTCCSPAGGMFDDDCLSII